MSELHCWESPFLRASKEWCVPPWLSSASASIRTASPVTQGPPATCVVFSLQNQSNSLRSGRHWTFWQILPVWRQFPIAFVPALHGDAERFTDQKIGGSSSKCAMLRRGAGGVPSHLCPCVLLGELRGLHSKWSDIKMMGLACTGSSGRKKKLHSWVAQTQHRRAESRNAPGHLWWSWAGAGATASVHCSVQTN